MKLTDIIKEYEVSMQKNGYKPSKTLNKVLSESKGKTLAAFDLDGTLVKTDALWRIIDKLGNLQKSITQEQGAEGDFDLQNGELELDFQEFSEESHFEEQLKSAVYITSMMRKLKKHYNAGDEIIILTARGNRKGLFETFGKEINKRLGGQIIKAAHVYATSSDSPESSRLSDKTPSGSANRKAEVIRGFCKYEEYSEPEISKSQTILDTFDTIYFYDDENKNINLIRSINEDDGIITNIKSVKVGDSLMHKVKSKIKSILSILKMSKIKEEGLNEQMELNKFIKFYESLHEGLELNEMARKGEDTPNGKVVRGRGKGIPRGGYETKSGIYNKDHKLIGASEDKKSSKKPAAKKAAPKKSNRKKSDDEDFAPTKVTPENYELGKKQLKSAIVRRAKSNEDFSAFIALVKKGFAYAQNKSQAKKAFIQQLNQIMNEPVDKRSKSTVKSILSQDTSTQRGYKGSAKGTFLDVIKKEIGIKGKKSSTK